jgi:hypothetical protein
MGCCGDRRRQASAWSSSMQTTRAPSVTEPTVRPAASETIRLTYRGDAPVILTGPGSGRLYRIEPDARVVAIDRRDVPALVATGRFARLEE